MASTDWLWMSEDRGGFIQSLGNDVPVFADEHYKPVLLVLARTPGKPWPFDDLRKACGLDDNNFRQRMTWLKAAIIEAAKEKEPTGFVTNAKRESGTAQREWYAVYRVNGQEVCRLVYKRDGNAALCLTVANLPLVRNDCAPVKGEARRVLCQDQPQTKFFHGRETERQTLAAFFEDAAYPEPDKLVMISALGGEGKTTLALQYWRDNQERYQWAFFVRADSESSLRNDYVTLLRVLADDETQAKRAAYQSALDAYDREPAQFPQVRDAVRGWMAQSDRYLVVFDNADFCTDAAREAYRLLLTGNAASLTPEQQTLAVAVSGQMTQDEFRVFLPSQHRGHLLVTSRNTAFDGKLGISETVELRAYSWTAGAAFLAHRAKNQRGALARLSEAERDAAEQIAQELGHLPLALEQAGAYIQAHFGDLAGYLALLRTKTTGRNSVTAGIEQAQPQAGEYPSSVARTYDISIEAIRAKHPAAVCALNLCAFLSPDNLFPTLFHYAAQSVRRNEDGTPTDTINSAHRLLPLYEVLQDVADDVFKTKIYAEIEEPLTRYSLLEIRPAENIYRMHRLVQEVVRHRIAADERKEWLNGAANGLLVGWLSNETYEDRRHLARHIGTLSLHLVEEAAYSPPAAALLAHAGIYLCEQGQYTEAEPLLERCLQLCKVALPYPHNDIASSLNNLATLYRTQGRYAEAEPLYNEALEIVRQVLTYPHNNIATSLNNLAALYETQGRYAEAEPLYNEALEIVRQVLTYPHNNIATSLNNLAALYETQGRYAEAEPLYNEALEIVRQVLTYPHDDIATSLGNLATLYETQGRYAEAEPLYNEALEIVRQVLTYPHNGIANVFNNLAGLYYGQGRYAEAELLYNEALAIRRQVLPYPHNGIVPSLNNLAALYFGQCRYAEAEPLISEALEIMQTTLGANHPNTKVVAGNLDILRKVMAGGSVVS